MYGEQKSLLHFIAVVSFVVFIALGQACGTMEPRMYSGSYTQSGSQPKLYSAYDYVIRGRKNEENGNYKLAIEDFTEAIRLAPSSNPSPAILYNERAWIYAYYLKTNFDQAIADATQAIRLEPNEAAYYDTRGWAYLGKGDYASAIDDFLKALQLDPNMEKSKEGLKKSREAQTEEAIDWGKWNILQ